MPSETTTTPTPSNTLTIDTIIMKSRERYKEKEREALETWRASGRHVAAAMNASGEARKALEVAREEVAREEELQARLDLQKRQRAYLAAKDARREALKVRRQAFKERARSAGLKTRHFFPLKELLRLMRRMPLRMLLRMLQHRQPSSCQHRPRAHLLLSLRR
jgi:hypothetical protein